MILMEADIKKAANLLAKCEHDLGRTINDHIGDLFADNFNDWSVEYCAEMRDAIRSGHGAAAYYYAEARKRFAQ